MNRGRRDLLRFLTAAGSGIVVGISYKPLSTFFNSEDHRAQMFQEKAPSLNENDASNLAKEQINEEAIIIGTCASATYLALK